MIRLISLIFSLILVQELSSQVFWKTEFIPNSTNLGQNFGRMINCNDSILLISANFDDSFGENSGSLYYYRKANNNWIFKEKIFPNDSSFEKAFGYFFWYDTVLFVRSGSWIQPEVYDFRLENKHWVQKAKLFQHRDSVFVSQILGFGSSCALYKNRLFVSAPYYSRYLDASGMVYEYAYKNGNYKFASRLAPLNPITRAQFGTSVVTDISHDALFISAPFDSSSHGLSAGSVSVFSLKNNQSTLQQILYPPEFDVNQCFGLALHLSGDYLFVGAPGNMYSRAGGRVYIYKYDTGYWKFIQVMYSPIAKVRDYFGYSISYYPPYLLIGSPEKDGVSQKNSKAFLYEWTPDGDCKLLKVFKSDVSEVDDQFGANVHLWKKDVFIGAGGGRNQGVMTGKAYLFSQTPTYISESKPEKHQVSVYPCPARDFSHIWISSSNNVPVAFWLFDLKGELIRKSETELYQGTGIWKVLNVNSLSNGVYVLRLQVGNEVTTQKFVVLH